MNIGQGIRQIREKTGINQIAFAKLIGITQSYMSQIERNKKKPSVELLEKISQQVFIPLPVLLWFTVDESDVKEGMEEPFKTMKPSIDELIYSFFLHKD